MSPQPITSIAIIGGDISAWAAAAWLANTLKGTAVKITLLELPDMVNAEPMQHTVPETLQYFEPLGIDAAELVRKTGATYKLGIGLHDIASDNDHRVLAFGPHGSVIGTVPFHHFVTRARQDGANLTLNEFSPSAVAARSGRFIRPEDAEAKNLPPLFYGLNFNTEKLTQLLSNNATINGVGVVRSRIDAVEFDTDNGFIDKLVLEDGATLSADFFVDCSGEDALLIGEACGIDFVDWSDVLPCSRSIAVTTKTDHDEIPVHHCTATDSGWLLKTPLQHRTACQYRYSPDHISDEAAAAELRDRVGLENADALAMSNIRSGYRRKIWHKNCIALGAAAGWVEPLDISNFHFLMSGLNKLTQLLPSRAMEATLATEYNQAMQDELECVRDFSLLHYHASAWRSGDFWDSVAAVSRPASFTQRLETFQSRGRVVYGEHETFTKETWAAAFFAARAFPEGYDPLLDTIEIEKLREHFLRMKQAIQQSVQSMPLHRDYLAGIRAQDSSRD